MIDYAIKYILDPIRNLGISRGHGQRFIDGWQIKKTGKLSLEVYNDFEYAHLLEYGWDDYDVFPKGKDMGGADVLKFNWKGKIIFAKHTHPRGFPGYKMLEAIDDWGFIDNYYDKMVDGANDWLERARLR